MTPAAIRACFSDWRPVKSRRDMRARFEDKFIPEPNSGCWLWLGASHPRGYGSFSVTTKWKTRAHAVAFWLYRGPVPAGMHVLHRCDTPACVNPDHLFLGTPADNAADREAKGRGKQPRGLRNGRHTKPERTCRGDRHPARLHPETRQGEKNGRAKLTAEQALAIRSDSRGCLRLSRAYGVTPTTIKKIRRGMLWRSL